MKLLEAAAKQSLTNDKNRPRITHGYAYNQEHQQIAPQIPKEDIHQAIVDATKEGTLIQFENGVYIYNFTRYKSLQELLEALYQREAPGDEKRYVIVSNHHNLDKKVKLSGSKDFWNSVPTLSPHRD